MSNSAFTPTFAQNLQDASATQKGLVNTTTQTFAGKKTFDGGAAIKGDTSGSAIAAGYVGEVVPAGTITSTAVSTTTIDVASSAGGAFRVSLKKGIWLLNYSLSVSYTTGAVANNNGYITTLITDNNDVAIPNTQRALNAYTTTAVAVTGFGCLACSTVVTVTTDDTVYKIRAAITNNAGTGSGAVDRSAGGAKYDSSFFGIRIA